ncbi:unnamed protein product [Notodromas monacha]|uniref:peptidylprolyl isomerase n=1 Tax=Notodromas monacha TaxID=399045 RepID=A0A7R9BI51_9CRUS|nr:unnamed protein product [Notodromas monacha]CAG0915937.1 unnamed protein product [Notodromas monacha]
MLGKDEDFADISENDIVGRSTPDVIPFDVPYQPGSDAVELVAETPGGIIKEVLTAGVGDDQPGTGDRITVHYTGRLRSTGAKFDSSKDHHGPPFQFTLGKGEVIKAWDIGVASMKKGEVARLTCDSEFAYGSRGSPPQIPPDADLIFDVELISWKGEDLTKDGDGGILRSTMVASSGFVTPNEGAVVNIHAVGKHEGRVFFEKDMEFRLDLGEADELPRGVEEALYKFHKGEKSVLKLSPQYGFGAEGNPQLGVPPNAHLVYEITLTDLTKAKDRWEMTNEEKINQGSLYKTLGTNYFQKGKLDVALQKYKKAIDFLDDGAVSESDSFDLDRDRSSTTSYEDAEEDFQGGGDAPEEISEVSDPRYPETESFVPNTPRREPPSTDTPEEKKSRNEVLLAVRLNLGLVALKLGEERESVEHCSKALDIDSSNEKAYFRRGQALLKMHEPEKALKDFNKVVELNPENKAAVGQIALCKKSVVDLQNRDKKIYQKMFELYSSGDNVGTSEKNEKKMETSASIEPQTAA